MRIFSWSPRPAPAAAFDGQPIPRPNWFSRTISKAWLLPLLHVGYSRPLELQDLYEVAEDMRCDRVSSRLRSNLIGPETPRGPLHLSIFPSNQATVPRITFFRALLLSVKSSLITGFVVESISQTIQLLIPEFTSLLITTLFELADPDREVQWYRLPAPIDSVCLDLNQLKGVLYAVSIFLISYGSRLGILWSQEHMFNGGHQQWAAVVDCIARKSLNLSPSSRNVYTIGRINNIVASDTRFLSTFVRDSAETVIHPLKVVASSAYLVYQLGPSSLVGIFIIGIFAFGDSYLFKRVLKGLKVHHSIVDQRLRVIGQVLTNIRAFKLHAYGSYFYERIMALRSQESKLLRKNGFKKALVHGSSDFVPLLAPIATLTIYAIAGNELKPARIFASLSAFSLLRWPLRKLPTTISNLVQAKASIDRINDLLHAEEQDFTLDIDRLRLQAIDVNADFLYGDQMDETRFRLKDVRFSAPRGSLVCITGRLGTGKSLCLLGMLREAGLLRGSVKFGGNVSYSAQQPWISSGTIRANICFTDDSDEVDFDRFDQVVEATGLKEDLAALPCGDMTEIGERGVNLSGGQKARVSLARAAYHDSDIVMLDDPLLALDARVADHVLRECLLGGCLAGRTRIIVTHQAMLLEQADLILVLDRENDHCAKVVQQGSPIELLAEGGLFKDILYPPSRSTTPSARTPALGLTRQNSGLNTPSHYGYANPHPMKSLTLKPLLAQSSSEAQESLRMTVTTSAHPKLILEEERAKNGVPSSIYIAYLSHVNSTALCLVAVGLLVFAQLAEALTTVWLGYFAKHSIKGLTDTGYIGVYIGLGVAYVILEVVSRLIFSVAGVRAANSLFSESLIHVLKAPLSWHERTPTGRILTRFSKDLAQTDDRVMPHLRVIMVQISTCIPVLAVLATQSPVVCFLFPPIILYLVVLSTFHRYSTRELRRLMTVTRSSQQSVFNEQISGATTIRVFDQRMPASLKLDHASDMATKAQTIYTYVTRFAWPRIQLLMCSVTLVTGLYGVFRAEHLDTTLFVATYVYLVAALQKIEDFPAQMKQCEEAMNSVDRLLYYGELPSEGDDIPRSLTRVQDSENDWPARGQITFTDVMLRYRPHLEPSLKGVSFDIAPGERIAVVGRTGASKSTLIQALLRCVEIESGTIAIDGRDTRSCDIEELRSKVSCVPQEPFLWNGTLRDNLDPHHTRLDADLNDLLDLVRDLELCPASLKTLLKLDAEIKDSGQNLSAGEKQIVALLRAMSRNTKVLILDEPTSNVDPQTDNLIQHLIQTKFENVTVLCVAHRLTTIADFDRVLVMEAGTVAELDDPCTLYSRPNSIFRALCQKQGIGLLGEESTAACANGM